MHLTLAFGKEGLEIELPDHLDATILHPALAGALPDERMALQQVLRGPEGTPPLRDLAHTDDQIVVLFSDLTRPMPNDRVLPLLLEELDHVPSTQITLLNALGTHRQQTKEELAVMLGAEIVQSYPIVQHDAWNDSQLIHVGETRFGNAVRLNRAYVEADVRIVTGFIEPHFFAGFSGGPKAILPGIAGIDAIWANHSAQLIAHPLATWGKTTGNPIYEEICEAAALAEPHFCLNVALNRERGITEVFAGHWRQVHQAGCQVIGRRATAWVDDPFDVVITTNSGYPLDLNLYQTVKGMSAAARILRPGGAIIAVSECSDGIPEHGEFKDLLWSTSSPSEFLDLIQEPGFFRQDQWEAQILAQILQQAQVYLYSDAFSDEEIHRAWLEPCRDIITTLEVLLNRYGPQARIGILPEGPQTIASLKKVGGHNE
jgi:nickel-dependent lactate racemase